MFEEICQGPGAHITCLACQITWPAGHEIHPFFFYFLAQLCFFPCIILLVNIFSLGEQKHTK
jgi:hypothetical protein